MNLRQLIRYELVRQLILEGCMSIECMYSASEYVRSYPECNVPAHVPFKDRSNEVIKD